MSAFALKRLLLVFLVGVLGVFLLTWIDSTTRDSSLVRLFAAGGDTAEGNDLPVDIDIESFSIAGSLRAPLQPGTISKLDLTLTNPYDEALTIRDLAVKVTAVAAPRSTAKLPCTAADFVSTSALDDIVLEADSTRTLSQLGLERSAWPTVGMLNTGVNQDGCKNAELTLSYSGTGVSS